MSAPATIREAIGLIAQYATELRMRHAVDTGGTRHWDDQDARLLYERCAHCFHDLCMLRGELDATYVEESSC